jgi:cytidylate kinase
MIIALDGPAGAGKSTVCKLLAQKLGFLYLDTGAMFRALAWALIEQIGHLPVDTMEEYLPTLALRFFIDESSLKIFYKDRELKEELRSPEISEAASAISRQQPVRSFLLDWQRKLAQGGNIVAEGRDTTTIVFPDAELKVFLTADLQTRMERRRAEYIQKGTVISPEEMEKSIRDRDEADANRDLAPMRPAEDAVVVDTSHLDITSVVDRLVAAARARIRGDRTTYHEL